MGLPVGTLLTLPTTNISPQWLSQFHKHVHMYLFVQNCKIYLSKIANCICPKLKKLFVQIVKYLNFRVWLWENPIDSHQPFATFHLNYCSCGYVCLWKTLLTLLCRDFLSFKTFTNVLSQGFFFKFAVGGNQSKHLKWLWANTAFGIGRQSLVEYCSLCHSLTRWKVFSDHRSASWSIRLR